MEAEGDGGKQGKTDSFCEHVRLFLKLLTLTNKVPESQTIVNGRSKLADKKGTIWRSV